MEAIIHDAVEMEDEVAFHSAVRGTQEGQFREIPPTGESFETQAIGVVRLGDGLVADYGLVFDRLGMLEQLGVRG